MRILLPVLICLSQTPPLWLAIGGLLIQLIQSFWASASTCLFYCASWLRRISAFLSLAQPNYFRCQTSSAECCLFSLWTFVMSVTNILLFNKAMLQQAQQSLFSMLLFWFIAGMFLLYSHIMIKNFNCPHTAEVILISVLYNRKVFCKVKKCFYLLF